MSRRATVRECGSTLYLPKGAVELRFRGLWLKDWGFGHGAKVNVTKTGQGVLEVRLAIEPGRDAGFEAALASFERVGL